MPTACWPSQIMFTGPGLDTLPRLAPQAGGSASISRRPEHGAANTFVLADKGLADTANHRHLYAMWESSASATPHAYSCRRRAIEPAPMRALSSAQSPEENQSPYRVFCSRFSRRRHPPARTVMILPVCTAATPWPAGGTFAIACSLPCHWQLRHSRGTMRALSPDIVALQRPVPFRRQIMRYGLHLPLLEPHTMVELAVAGEAAGWGIHLGYDLGARCLGCARSDCDPDTPTAAGTNSHSSLAPPPMEACERGDNAGPSLRWPCDSATRVRGSRYRV